MGGIAIELEVGLGSAARSTSSTRRKKSIHHRENMGRTILVLSLGFSCRWNLFIGFPAPNVLQSKRSLYEFSGPFIKGRFNLCWCCYRADAGGACHE